MDSSNLTPAQLDKLRRAVARPRDYLFKLVTRMRAQSFPDDDPLRVAAARANDAVDDLYLHLAELCHEETVKELERSPRSYKARQSRPTL